LAARAHATLAGALIARGTFAEAVDILQAALQRSPADPTLTRQLAYARWRFARSLHASARVFDAIDEYRAALALDDTNADCWNELANACTDAGPLAEAQRRYRGTPK